MNQRKKKARLILCIMLILCVVGIIGYKRKLDKDAIAEAEEIARKAYEDQFSYFTHRNNAVKEYQVCYDESSGIYGFLYRFEETEEWSLDQPIIISKEYFINVDYRGTTKYYKRKKNEVRYEEILVDELIDYFTLEFINLKTGEIDKKLDIKVLLAEYLDENIYGTYINQGMRIGDQLYLRFRLYKKLEQEEMWQEEPEEIYLLFNIKTENFEIVEDPQQINQLWGGDYWDINDSFLHLNGLKDDDFKYIMIKELYEQRELQVRIKNDMIFQKDLKLYELFPELRSYAKESQNERLFICMPVNEETTALDILEYFVDPEVGLRFDGFTLTEKESIDGQKHYIESREQFEQYYNGYWEEHD